MSITQEEEAWLIQILDLYRQGAFPMAPDKDSDIIEIFRPARRGIFELSGFHIPTSLRKIVKKDPFDIRVNRNFSGTVHACAARDECWINHTLLHSYELLHIAGHASSVEAWQDKELVGGLFGVHFGAVFCGESMFSTRSNASKVALVHLVAKMIRSKFVLLDTQYVNRHLVQFGNLEIEDQLYRSRLASARDKKISFQSFTAAETGREALAIIDNFQTSS